MPPLLTRILRIVLMISGVCLTLFILGACVVPMMLDRYLAAEPYFDDLIGSSDWHSIDAAQARLLQRLPRGTSETAIYAFLEAHGLERDRFTGGQLMRYQVKNEQQAILGVLSDSPYRFTLVCSSGGYIIWFQLDARDQLSDITIRSTAVCL